MRSPCAHLPRAPKAWIVSQKNLVTGAFDEYKILCGFAKASEALDCYVRSYSDGRGGERIMKVDEVDAAGLARFLADWRPQEKAA